MTTRDLSARNRANARKSTGPTSAQGKAVVAGNARRHGATAQPDPARVADWLAIILDTPDLTPAHLVPGDEGGFWALALADAEARKTAAERALYEFEARRGEANKKVQALRGTAAALLQDLHATEVMDQGGTSVAEILNEIEALQAQETHLDGKRHRLLQRYVSEARARRKRAFAAWAACRQAAQEGNGVVR